MKKLFMFLAVLLVVALLVGCESSVRQVAELQEPAEALEVIPDESENKATERDGSLNAECVDILILPKTGKYCILMLNGNLEAHMHCYEPDHDKETWMTEIICNRCGNKQGGMTCKAFPNGIPMQIFRENAHYVSVPGDNGIIFAEK